MQKLLSAEVTFHCFYQFLLKVKESVNLKGLQSASINIDDCLELVLENGDKLLYKGPELNMWLGKITIRADWAQDKIKPPLLMADSSDLYDPARTSSEASSNNSSASTHTTLAN